MALSDFLTETLTKQQKAGQPDGMGGSAWTYQDDGEPFRAGIVRKSDAAALIAEQNGSAAIYTIVTDAAVTLDPGDVVKRGDGAYFRITSRAADMTTPAAASMRYKQATAERMTA